MPEKATHHYINRRWPELLSGAVLVARKQLKRSGMSDQRALAEAEALIAELCGYLGGQYIYWPKSDRFRRAQRDAKIAEAFDGRNVSHLARKFDLSTAQIRSILRAERRLAQTN